MTLTILFALFASLRSLPVVLLPPPVAQPLMAAARRLIGALAGSHQ